MPISFIKKPWNSRPPRGTYLVDMTHPLAQGLVLYSPVLDDTGRTNLVPGSRVLTESPAQAASYGIWRRDTDCVTSTLYRGNSCCYPSRTPRRDIFSCIVIFKTSDISTCAPNLLIANDVSVVLPHTAALVGLTVANGGTLYARIHDGFTTSYDVTTTIQSETWYVAVMTYCKGGYLRLYLNGVEVGTPVVASIDVLALSKLTFGHANAGFTSIASRNSWRLAGWWDSRELTAQEVARISANPYQILRPEILPLYYETGAPPSGIMLGVTKTGNLNLVRL